MKENKQREELLAFICENLHLSDKEIGRKVGKTKGAIFQLRKRNGIYRSSEERPTIEQVEGDEALRRITKKHRVTDAKYRKLLDKTELLEKKLAAVQELSNTINAFTINTHKRGVENEQTIVALASDWHIEERVTLEQTSGLSQYNLEISEGRSKHFFRILERIIENADRDTKVRHLVLALLGDFISGDIHEDTSKSALLEPVQAIVRCREYIHSGIQFLLNQTDIPITVVCHSGNHGRKGRDQLIANEAGNSLEFLMYHFLAADFADNDRVTFMIPEGYHSYIDVYDVTIRFHHGHAIRYGGGVGGITIPVRKAINQWNQGRKADLDCFGHFHQAFDGNNFVCNGSMIGYSAYGLFVKGEFQKPMQMTFGIHSKHGKNVTRQIMFPTT